MKNINREITAVRCCGLFALGGIVATAQTTNTTGLEGENTATNAPATNAASGVLFTLPTVPIVGNPSPVTPP